MIFEDYSPVREPPLSTQEDALQKGLGRSAQWAQSGQLSPEVLLDACLLDKRFDMQIEENRGDWLWELVMSLEVAKSFRTPVLGALRSCADEKNAYQLCELVYHYAAAGDDECEKTLWQFVDHRQIPDAPWVGEGQLLRLRGMDAFKAIARIRGRSLTERDWDWDDDALIDRAIELLGEQCVEAFLADAVDNDVRRFTVHRQQGQPRSTNSLRSSMWGKKCTVEEVIAAAHGESNCYWFRRWGRTADVSDLQAVLSAVPQIADPPVIARLLHVFSARPAPSSADHLIDLCQHPDRDVRHRAIAAVENIQSQAIRKFALQRLDSEFAGEVVGLFAKNFDRRDEDRILQAISLPENPFELHSMLMRVKEVLRANPQADPSQLAVVLYRFTPCQFCREGAVRLLVDRAVAPTWLTDEARLDAEEEIRQLATK